MSLASLQYVEKVLPVENSDNLDVVTILGWNSVVKRGEFSPGDLCIYIEIDSLVPRKTWSEFLFKSVNKEYERIRTIKLRGQLSQGLVIPIWILKDYVNPDQWTEYMLVGKDLSELLGVIKYEKPAPNSQNSKGNFPPFLRKTDEERIQSNPKLLDILEGKSYYITQKLDGTSATYYKYGGQFGVCSRNLELKKPGDGEYNVYWAMAEKYKIEEWLPEGFCIQGEICGPGIGGNKLGLDSVQLFVFNVFDINNHEFRPAHRTWQYLDGPTTLCLNCHLVPLLEEKSVERVFELTIEHLLDIAKAGKYPNGNPQEGIVVRSLDQTVSFKVLNNEFLLKYGE